MSLPLKMDKLLCNVTEHAAEVMVYFEKHKLLEIVSRIVAEISLVRPEDAQLWIAKNIVRIADEIYSNCLESSYTKGGGDNVKFFQLPRRFLYRVVIFGRRGSGRKTQARSLVKRFNLVYIDAEQIIYQNLTGTDDVAKQLQQAFASDDVRSKSIVLGKLLSRRLLQDDCLRQGWVMLNYPCNLEEFQEIFENFKIPPNKLIYLQCPERLCMRRLVERPKLGRPQDNCTYSEHEMRYYTKNEKAIDEYLARRHETIYINGIGCFEVVKCHLWAELQHTPYVTGFKN